MGLRGRGVLVNFFFLSWQRRERAIDGSFFVDIVNLTMGRK